MIELPERLVTAALAALPLDPTSDGEMVVSWDVVVTTDEDRANEPNLPERYAVHVIDDARPVAVRVIRAVLMELATTASRDFALQLLDVADRLPPAPSVGADPEDEVGREAQGCEACGGDVEHQPFTGGREYYSPANWARQLYDAVVARYGRTDQAATLAEELADLVRGWGSAVATPVDTKQTNPSHGDLSGPRAQQLQGDPEQTIRPADTQTERGEQLRRLVTDLQGARDVDLSGAYAAGFADGQVQAGNDLELLLDEPAGAAVPAPADTETGA